MASIYYRGKTPAGSWWLQYYHPRSGKLERFSLATGDRCAADLIRMRVDIEIELLKPTIASARVPAVVLENLGILSDASSEAPAMEVPEREIRNGSSASPKNGSLEKKKENRATLIEGLERYINLIRAENADAHLPKKMSILRLMFGSDALEAAGGDRGPFCEPGIDIQYLDELTASAAGRYLRRRDAEEAVRVTRGSQGTKAQPEPPLKGANAKMLKRKTLRHYREVLHHFAEVLLKIGMMQPGNFHCPNPMAALPSYGTKGKQRIIFLQPKEVDEQLTALSDHAALHAGVMIMIEAGLRRSEALWLTRDSIAADFSHLRVINRKDEDLADESSLKTGERTVSISPKLKRFLQEYLPMLKGDWLIPSPVGQRWNGDAFAAE
ncbi:MAG TPA: site-specific integrase, partial [Chthoniobacteraceae bacterium]|nr:site-specific integrase [Chthoniobacteraceae bacterium]